MMKRFLFAVFLLSLFMGYSLAQEVRVPIEVQYRLFTKVLTFDRNLHSRSGDILRIGILYQEHYRPSVNVKNEFLRVYENSSLADNENIVFECVPFDIENKEDLENLIDQQKFDIVYLAPLRNIDITTLVLLCQNLKIITFSSIPDYVEEGANISFDLEGNRPRIVINLEALKKTGADFNSQLLKLSKIVH